MDCKKCKAPGTVLLRKKDFYCQQCFLANTTHKFRACIGKNRVLSSNENVLLAVSGGVSSSVLLDLVHSGVKLDNHKILRISPVCVHITGLKGNDENISDAEAVIKQCNQYEFDVYVVPLLNSTEQPLVLPDKNCVPLTTQEDIIMFNSVWEKYSSTSWNDLVVKLKRNIYITIGNLLQCKYVFTGETTTTLASSLLSNLSLGRGSQIEHDAGFIDTRDETVKILRPMKDISQEELVNYASLKKLPYIHRNNIQDKSLQSLIRSFVVELQHNFPATISTVYKTSEKIGTYDGNSTKLIKCGFCQSDINVKNSKLTALEATNFSQAVCYGQSRVDDVAPTSEIDLQSTHNITSMYCYACKRNKLLK